MTSGFLFDDLKWLLLRLLGRCFLLFRGPAVLKSRNCRDAMKAEAAEKPRVSKEMR